MLLDLLLKQESKCQCGKKYLIEYLFSENKSVFCVLLFR